MSLAKDGPPKCPECEKVIMLTWSYCASCGARLDDPEPAHETDGSDIPLAAFPLDHRDPDDLRRAYEAEDSIKAASEWFEPSYNYIYNLLVEAGIHEPE